MIDTFHARHAGRILMISSLDNDGDYAEVKFSSALVQDSARQPLVDWLRANQIDDIASDLGISRARAQRLRKALGLTQAGPHHGEGKSRTTIWRHKKAGE